MKDNKPLLQLGFSFTANCIKPFMLASKNRLLYFSYNNLANKCCGYKKAAE
jgi:hypothetical protein